MPAQEGSEPAVFADNPQIGTVCRPDEKMAIGQQRGAAYFFIEDPRTGFAVGAPDARSSPGRRHQQAAVRKLMIL